MRRTSGSSRFPGLWISVAIATSLSGVAYSGAGVWTTGGPYGGDISSLAIDLLTPATLYAGTYGGGLFKSTDAGSAWAAANMGLTAQSVLSVAIDPTDPATLYVGASRGGVFRSTDSGATWVAANAGLTNLDVQIVAIDPVAPTTLYAGASNDFGNPILFKSTDAGSTWAAATVGLEYRTVTSLAIDPTTPATVYAGTIFGGGVFKSTDSGGS